ncbi:HECT-domain (ubiquitin-transferase), putative [Leishmania shawi]|uniref:HECT-domain (Ubiquitin-transferase) n=1 Tax=Leishmania shawi TaxID=5680 RepID=A0ABR3E8W3_9TRYP
MNEAAPFCVAPQTWQGGLARYPASQSHMWNNNIILQPEDIDVEVFTAICQVEKQYNKNEISDEDFETLQLTFCLFTVNQSCYDLIPNGREIRVTQANAFEFFQRVHAPYDNLKQAPTLNQPTESTSPPRLRMTGARLRLTAQNTDDLEWIRWTAQNDPAALAFHPDEPLRWAVVPRSRDFMIRVQPEGEKTFVGPDHLGLFLDALAILLTEIERAISVFGYYPPNCIAAAPVMDHDKHSIHTSQPPRITHLPFPPQRVNSPRRSSLQRSTMSVSATAAAAAATMQNRRIICRASSAELEKQRALFSPTHDTGGLLAPFQELNV